MPQLLFAAVSAYDKGRRLIILYILNLLSGGQRLVVISLYDIFFIKAVEIGTKNQSFGV